MFALQNGPLTKPTAESLQKQRMGLKKTSTRIAPASNAWCSNFSLAQNLLATKIPKNVQEARVFFKNLLVMDDNTNAHGVFFDLARCESLLGNFQESISYLVKSVSLNGNIDAKLIEDQPDFIPLKQVEAFITLVSFLKTSHQSPQPTGFLQFYLSTLRCVDVSDTACMEKVKWPIREAEKTEVKN